MLWITFNIFLFIISLWFQKNQTWTRGCTSLYTLKQWQSPWCAYFAILCSLLKVSANSTGTFCNKVSWRSIYSTESRNTCCNSVSDLYWTPADQNFFPFAFHLKMAEKSPEHHQCDFFICLLWTCYCFVVTCFYFGNMFRVYLLTSAWWSFQKGIKYILVLKILYERFLLCPKMYHNSTQQVFHNLFGENAE